MKKFNTFATFLLLLQFFSLLFVGCDSDVNQPIEECFCDEAKTVACPEGGEEACVKTETACTCEPTCKENENCVKHEDGACGCSIKDETLVCNPVCTDGKECKCEADKCECVDKTVEECFCDEAKTVACPEGGKESCVVNASVPEDVCKGKAENDECGETKTCQKVAEGDKLECKDKLVV